jgi:hypothetical protein
MFGKYFQLYYSIIAYEKRPNEISNKLRFIYCELELIIESDSSLKIQLEYYIGLKKQPSYVRRTEAVHDIACYRRQISRYMLAYVVLVTELVESAFVSDIFNDYIYLMLLVIGIVEYTSICVEFAI